MKELGHHTGIEYMLHQGGQMVSSGVPLIDAFLPPFKEKYCIKQTSEYVYSFNLSTSALGSQRCNRTKPEVVNLVEPYPLFADNFSMKLCHFIRSEDDVELQFAERVQKMI